MKTLIVILVTTLGNITLELYPEKAPLTVDNFVTYAEAGHYDGTVFHRVIDGFMVQGGGHLENMQQKPTRAPIRNEADNGLKNTRGSIAMARTADPHSATSQFFINLVANPSLDHTAKTPQGWGYAVFGRVVDGMEVVDLIATTPTGRKGPYADVPLTPIVIMEVQVVRESPPASAAQATDSP